MTTMFHVNTTNGDNIPAGFVLISNNLRDTKEVKPTAEQRYRNVVIPELSIPSVESRFIPMLLEALYGVATRRFAALMEETNRNAKEVSSDDYTLSALLSYYETEATSGRLNKQQVLDWFKAGDTFAAVLLKKGDKEAAKWVELFGKFASPNHGVNPNTCRVLLASMQPKDAASDIGKAIAASMQRTISKSEATQVEGL